MEEDEDKPPAPSSTQDGRAATAAASDGSARGSARPAPVVLHSSSIVSLATKKPRRSTKRGWGPFQSVVKERSADFNLTLDVHNLRQEVQQLASVRDLKRSKVLIQRHSPEGSLARMVHECFRVFRLGSPASPTERRHSTGSAPVDGSRAHRSPSAATETPGSGDRHAPASDWSQRQLLRRMMDERVDFGGDGRGPDALGDLIQRLSRSLRILGLSLNALEVVAAEDAVIVATRAKLRFRVVPETILEQFPHIRAHRRLVSSLMGREVEAGGRVVFYFDERDKCVRILRDVDFVGAFGAVLAEPCDLAMLLDAGFFETATAPGPAAAELDAIDSYFRCFESAFVLFDPESPDRHGRLDFVRAYMAWSFTPDMRYARHLAGWRALERRWAALGGSFELRAFRIDGQPRDVTSGDGGGLSQRRLVAVRAAYSLRITPRTLARVFPLLLLPRNAPIQRHLLGQTLVVPAQITFALDAARRIARVDERVEFATAMREVLRPLEAVDADALLADARLAESGLG